MLVIWSFKICQMTKRLKGGAFWLFLTVGERAFYKI